MVLGAAGVRGSCGAANASGSYSKILGLPYAVENPNAPVTKFEQVLCPIIDRCLSAGARVIVGNYNADLVFDCNSESHKNVAHTKDAKRSTTFAQYTKLQSTVVQTAISAQAQRSINEGKTFIAFIAHHMENLPHVAHIYDKVGEVQRIPNVVYDDAAPDAVALQVRIRHPSLLYGTGEQLQTEMLHIIANGCKRPLTKAEIEIRRKKAEKATAKKKAKKKAKEGRGNGSGGGSGGGGGGGGGKPPKLRRW
jgi:hypothetical protein